MEAAIMKKLTTIGLFFVIIFVLSGCNKADVDYSSGKKYFDSGNYEEAVKYFSSAIENNPNRAEYYIGYGMSLIGSEKYDEAIVQFDRIIMEKKISMVLENNKRALRGKGIAYVNMQNYLEAINMFDKALKINELSDLNMDILYYKGNVLINTGFYREAAEIYTLIMDQFGEDAQILGNRAYAYQKLGEYEKGIDDFDRAIALQNTNYEYYYGKYYLLQNMGRNNDANEVLSRAAELEIKTKADKFNLAKIHFYQGLYDQAFPELSESFGNGFTEAYIYIGEIYSQKKDYSTAKYYYEKYIEEGAAASYEVYNQIASCHIKMDEYEQAIPYLETGLKFANNNEARILRKNEIIAYENLGDFEKALNKLQGYIVSYPDDELAKNELSFIVSRQAGKSVTIDSQ
jgi:tetratricopeptide (TPR) repeat protein